MAENPVVLYCCHVVLTYGLSPCAGQPELCPAFVRDDQGGARALWRFMMPESGPAGTAPAGAWQPLLLLRSSSVPFLAHLRMPLPSRHHQCPPPCTCAGMGDGCFKPLGRVRTTVAVVGSAHVQGMVHEWQQALGAGSRPDGSSSSSRVMQLLSP